MDYKTCCIMRGGAVRHNAAVMVIIIIVKIHSVVMSLGQSLENCFVAK